MKRLEWRTLASASKIEYVDQKSVFIAQAKPIASVEEANEFVAAVRAEYPDARHHVYAWRLGGETVYQKYSDDGEPAGTAGMPVLDVLRKNDIDDAAVVVTRYFGGILLGTGGLVRAYGRSALMAVEAAVPTVFHICELYEVMVSYSYLDKLLFSLEKAAYTVKKTTYDMDPTIFVLCDAGESEPLIRLCTDITNGQAIIEYAGEDICGRAKECLP